MNKTFLRLLGVTMISLAALGAAQAQNIAIVNGKPVPKSAADYMLKQVEDQGQPITPQLEQQAKDAAVTREILVQEAERRGLQRSKDYLDALEFQRRNLLINALFKDEAKTHPPSEAEMRKEYDQARAQIGDKEYHARHILVPTEAEAKSLIAKLKGGAKFEDLAKKYSKDTGSASHGGDLDWAAPSSYVPEFSAAMVKLKKGEFTTEPVKSQYGYHIIKLDDVRDAKFPSFEEVRPELEKRAEQQQRGQLVDQLRHAAKIEGFSFDTAPAAAASAASK